MIFVSLFKKFEQIRYWSGYHELNKYIKNNLEKSNNEQNRLLDDILLFSILDNSYIAKDIELTEKNINKVMKNMDISKGIVVFINEGQENDELLAKVIKATKLQKREYLKRLNACDVYFIKKVLEKVAKNFRM